MKITQTQHFRSHWKTAEVISTIVILIRCFEIENTLCALSLNATRFDDAIRKWIWLVAENRPSENSKWTKQEHNACTHKTYTKSSFCLIFERERSRFDEWKWRDTSESHHEFWNVLIVNKFFIENVHLYLSNYNLTPRRLVVAIDWTNWLFPTCFECAATTELRSFYFAFDTKFN